MISSRIVCFGKKKNRELSLIEMQDYLVNWEAGTLGLTFRPELGTELPPVVFQVLNEKSIARFSGVQVGDLLVSINGKKTSFLGYDRAMRRLYKGKLPMMLHFRTPLKNHILQNQFGVNNCTAHHTDERSFPSCSRPNALPMLEDHGPTIELAPELEDDPASQYPDERHHHEDPLYSPSSPSRAQPGAAVHRACRSQSKKKLRPCELRSKEPGKEKKSKAKKPFKVVWERGNLGMSFCKYRESVPLPMVDFILDDGYQGSPGHVAIGKNIDRVRVGDVLVGINSYKTKRLGFEKSLFLLNSLSKPVILRFISTVCESAEKTSSCSSESMPDIQLRTERNERSRKSSRCDARRHHFEEQTMRELHTIEDIHGRKHSARRSGKTDRLHSEIHREGCDTGFSTKHGNSVARKGHKAHPQQGPKTMNMVFKSQETVNNQEHNEETVKGESTKARMSYEAQKLRQSQILNNLKKSSSKASLSLAASMMLVIGMSNEPLDRIKFAGVPLFLIQEGSTEAQLLQVYARACLAGRKKTDEKKVPLLSPVKPSVPSFGTTSTRRKDQKQPPFTTFEAVSARAQETYNGLTVSALGTTPNAPQPSQTALYNDEAFDSQDDAPSPHFYGNEKPTSKPVLNEKESLMQSNSNVAMFALRCADSSHANQVVKIKRTLEPSSRTERAISRDFIPLYANNAVDAAPRLSRKPNDQSHRFPSKDIHKVSTQYTIRSDGCLESVDSNSSSSRVEADLRATNESLVDGQSPVSVSNPMQSERLYTETDSLGVRVLKLKAFLGGILDTKSDDLIIQKAALVDEIKNLVDSIFMYTKSITQESTQACPQCGSADNGILNLDACAQCRERYFVSDHSPISTIHGDFIGRTLESGGSKSSVTGCEAELEEVLSDGPYDDTKQLGGYSDFLASDDLHAGTLGSLVQPHRSQDDSYWYTA